jgi:MobA/VirD2-like, nuclease domain
MMAKVFRPASSFGRVCRYVSRDLRRSVVLDAEGVRGHDYKLLARDFEIIRSQRESIGHPVFHGVIDFYPKEELNDGQLIKIARAYMQEMGLVNTQYAVVKHIDKEHRHLHVVANRINFEGEHLNLYPAQFRSNDIVRELAREYGLTPPGQKNLREMNFNALHGPETRKYAIYRSIKECLPGCQDFEELERRLRHEGIDVRYRIDDRTGERTGISYRYLGFSFKGSDIDREYSFGQLHEKLVQQRILTQWQAQKLELRAVQLVEEQKVKLEQAALVQRQQQQREEEKKVLELTQKMEREEEVQQQRRAQRQEQMLVPRLRIH